MPPRFTADTVMHALRSAAVRYSSLKAGGRLKLVVKGRKQPGIRFRLKWKRASDNLKIRMTGLGPFGVTVFDCLVTDTAVYLYIPSHDRVYAAGLRSRLAGSRDMDSIMYEVFLALNPWSAGFHPMAEVMNREDIDGEAGGRDPVMIEFPENGYRARAVFDLPRLNPLSLELSDLKVEYGNSRVLSEASSFPSVIRSALKRYQVEAEISFSRVEPGNPAPGGLDFSPEPFLKQEIQHLGVLMSHIR